MSKLITQFPTFADEYDGNKMRFFIQNLERALGLVDVDKTRGAYVTTSNVTLGALDNVVLVDSSGGNVTITLPEISDDMVRGHRMFEVVKIAAANTVTVAPTGADTIVGDTDALLTIQWTALHFCAAEGNWVIV